MFTTIVITRPDFFAGESEQICRMLERGVERGGKRWAVDIVHVRKPDATAAETEALLRAIPLSLRSRLVLHDHFSLASRYALRGVHLNRRNPSAPPGWQGTVSRSCHGMDEVAQWKDRCDYVSLSPIYDSVSKQGYRSAFSREEIEQAVADGTINNKVYALGGIAFERLEQVESLGFGGAMILGDAWKPF